MTDSFRSQSDMIAETNVNENELKFDYTEVAAKINESYGLNWDNEVIDALVSLYYDPEVDSSIFEFLSVFAEHQERL